MEKDNGNQKLQLLVEDISRGDGDYERNVEELTTFGEQALVALLNVHPTNIEKKRDFRDSRRDIGGALSAVVKANVSEAIKLFELEIVKTEINSGNNKFSYLAHCFSQFFHKDLLPALALGMMHKNKFVRELCSDCLRNSKSPDALPLLANALKDRVEDVKFTAVRAMSEFGTKEYIPKLEKITKAKNKLMAEHARDAIAEIQSRES